ncbi:MFS transporter [Streptomyces sp. NPDC088746]|uniref:MFS transporter n=1 Tax=Streptomyces sp. NPDC088746 TaxID=3365885 RepID=UPI00382C93DC
MTDNEVTVITSRSGHRAGSGTAPVDESGTGPGRPSGERRLLGGLMANSVALYAVYGAVPAVLLADLVGEVDPDNKSTALGVISAIGAIAALLANPIAGALSDRTRSRFGRRAPWMAGGALLGGLSLIAVGSGNSLLWIAVAWTLTQIFFNGLQAPLTAVVPDRTPVHRRGVFSSAAGLAQMIGATAGTALAAGFANALGLGFAVFGLLVIAGTAVFLLLNREPSSAGAPVTPFHLKTFLAGFWVSPRRHPDFAWAFLGRFLMILGYYSVSSYQLYILEDYIGLSHDRAHDLLPLLSVAMLPGMIIMIVVMGPLSDRIGRRKPFIIAASLGMALALVVPFIVSSQGAMFAFAVIAGLSFGTYMAVDTALMTQVLPNQGDAAKDMGVLNIANSAPQALAPALSAAVIGLLGGYRPLFAVAIVLVVAAAVSVRPIRSVR